MNVPEGLRVWVTHYRDPVIDYRSTKVHTLTPIVAATCVEIRSEDETVLGVGWAYCSENDQFSKKMGRMIATGRALKDYEKQFERTQ